MMQSLGRPIDVDEVVVADEAEAGSVDDRRMRDYVHASRKRHFLVCANQRPLHHCVALPVGEKMFDKEAAQHLHLKYGIEIAGEWGGSWIITVRDREWFIAESEEISDVQAIVHYDHPSDMVLNSYLRLEAGRTSGDQAVIQMARKLFNRPI
jgi:hypothetical protein